MRTFLLCAVLSVATLSSVSEACHRWGNKGNSCGTTYYTYTCAPVKSYSCGTTYYAGCGTASYWHGVAYTFPNGSVLPALTAGYRWESLGGNTFRIVGTGTTGPAVQPKPPTPDPKIPVTPPQPTPKTNPAPQRPPVTDTFPAPGRPAIEVK